MKPKVLLLAFLGFATMAVWAQPWATAKLDKSTRHGEWVTVTNGTRPVRCWVVYPEVKDKATPVLVIHEIFGLTDWARAMTDELAGAGYIAIAPDLLSGAGTNGGGTSEFTQDQAIAAIRKLSDDQITGDLNAAADYVKALPAANGKLVVAGFCWGGTQTFRYACNRPDLKAAFVFYGMAPNAANMAKIQCPVYGFYGGSDRGISTAVTNSTDTGPSTVDLMKKAGKTYEPVIYDGARHGFMRAGEPEAPGARPADRTARDSAWVRLKDLLGKI